MKSAAAAAAAAAAAPKNIAVVIAGECPAIFACSIVSSECCGDVTA